MLVQIYISIAYAIAAGIAILMGKKLISCISLYLVLILIVSCSTVILDLPFNAITLCGILLSGFIFVVLLPKIVKRPQYKVPLKTKAGSTYYLNDINMGVFISGASGSGKSTILKGVLEHCAKWKFAGVIHDYKDFELTESVGTLFAQAGMLINVFAIHAPNQSVRINPIDPKYLINENVVRGIVKNLFLNLKGVSKGESFFRDAAESIVVAVIWRMRNEFPELCNLPFIVALLLQTKALHIKDGDYGYLIQFLSEKSEYAVKASTFLSGVVAEKQTAGVYGDLTNSLTILDNPNIMYLLSSSDIDLNIVDDDNRQVLSVVNKPGLDAVCQAPINAMVIDIIMNLIDRNKKPSFIALDEAPMVKIYNLEQRVATLRSYGVAFIYAMQDLVQGRLQWGGEDMYIKSTVANLSDRLLGKANDPDTATYYEKLFEIIKVKQKSFTSGAGFGNLDSRQTTSYQDRKKIRAFEFQTLKIGEFIMLSGGNHKKIRFKRHITPKYSVPAKRVISDKELQQYSQSLYKLAAEFIAGGWLDCSKEIINKFKTIQL